MSNLNYGRNGFNKNVIILALPISILFFLMGGMLGFVFVWVVALFLIGKSEYHTSMNIYSVKNQLDYNNYGGIKHKFKTSYIGKLTEEEMKYIDAYLTAAEKYKILYKKPITPNVYRSIASTIGFPNRNNYWFEYGENTFEIYKLIKAPDGMNKMDIVKNGYPKKEMLFKFM